MTYTYSPWFYYRLSLGLKDKILPQLENSNSFNISWEEWHEVTDKDPIVLAKINFTNSTYYTIKICNNARKRYINACKKKEPHFEES